MKVAPLSASELAVVKANLQLSQYLESLTHEVPYTKRSWLYEDVRDPDQILGAWLDKLKVLEKGQAAEREVFQFDTSQLEKWGPQGGHESMKALFSDVVLPTFQGSTTKPAAFATRQWQKAKQKTTHTLMTTGKLNRIRPATYEHVIDDMRARDTLESNAGWPDFRRRSVPEVKASALEDAQSGRWKTYPAIALFRRYNGKTRLVWMFPMSANLVEGSFFQPLQSTLARSPLALRFFAPWTGFEQVRTLIGEAYSARRFVFASDFSSTDAHFQLSTSMEVADVLEPCIQPAYREAFRDSIAAMHTIPLVIGPNEKLTGLHGVSSGSNWTNFIETVFDMIFSYYVEELTGVAGLFAIGDDAAWVSQQYSEDFGEQLEDAAASVGQQVKAEKTNVYRDKVKSLQRLFQRGYNSENGIRAVYPTLRALKSSVFPERFHSPKKWNSDMFCARQFMILENCVDHPLFEEFVRFVCSGHRDLIPFAQKSASELSRITRESKLIPGLNPTYNQERRDSSLANFKSVLLARTQIGRASCRERV